MTEKVFSINGFKSSCFIIDENSIKFSSQNHTSYSDFTASWNRNVSFANKSEISLNKIKSIKKEEGGKRIVINYKNSLGITTDGAFIFNDESDVEVFFGFLEKEKTFAKTLIGLSPIKAIRNYIFWLLVTIASSIFAYFYAAAVENGTTEIKHSRRNGLFNILVQTLGSEGIIIVGAIITIYFTYKIGGRYKNPPKQIVLVPPLS